MSNSHRQYESRNGHRDQAEYASITKGELAKLRAWCQQHTEVAHEREKTLSSHWTAHNAKRRENGLSE